MRCDILKAARNILRAAVFCFDKGTEANYEIAAANRSIFRRDDQFACADAERKRECAADPCRIFATKEARLFEKYGFDAEMIYVQGVQLIQVHVAGQLDFSTVSSVVYLQASVEGADLVQIGSSIDGQIMKVMVHPSITKPQDLKGKTLAVTPFGSLTDLLIRPALKNWGLEPQKDVKLIQIGRMPDIVTAISQRTVDGGVISFPTSIQAEKLNLKTLLDYADSGYEIPATTVVISRKFGKSNRDEVLRFLK
ncbi:MAG: ABC transporter substrate-binding protein [Deltaproteobacteria bacterium]|nr:MAG: ABC transporter substrate-binding protein [Deltaproteobacteria bacterium]